MDDTPASTSDDAPSLKGHGNQIAKLAFVFLMGVTVTAVGLTLSNQVRPAPIEILAPAPLPTGAPSATPGLIRVYVSGEVVAPAVYQLSPDSIVEAAVRAAGGFTDEANTAAVNLAQPLADGAQIYIPSHGEVVASPEGILLMPVPSTMIHRQ
jgi:competence protein ComEA